MNRWLLGADEVTKQVLHDASYPATCAIVTVVEDSTVTAHIILFGITMRSIQQHSMKLT